MTDTFQRRGWWWRTMGFTKTHIVGVFVTESVLLLIGVVLVLASFVLPFETAQRLLLTAVCVFLAQIAVLLSSILSLLFYLGSRVESATAEREQPQ